jgi:hypothetical protein
MPRLGPKSREIAVFSLKPVPQLVKASPFRRDGAVALREPAYRAWMAAGLPIAGRNSPT